MVQRKDRFKVTSLWCIVTLLAALGFAACAGAPSGVQTPDAGQAALGADADVPAPAVNDTTVFDPIPASKIAELLSPGWNLGNQLEGVTLKTDAAAGVTVTYPSETGYMATRISNELLAAVKAAGFKFVRIPVSYFAYIDDAAGYAIKADWLARIKEVVDLCIANGLYCMINIHGDGYYTIRNSWLLCAEKDQAPILAKYTAVWKQLAETFKDYDESLLFESMNEVFNGSYDAPDPVAYENLNAYNDAFVATVRASGGNNARRWLVVPGWNTDINNTIDTMGKKGGFRLPKDKNLIVSVHYYDPWGFCGGENGTATQWGSFAADPAKSNGTEVSMAKQFNRLQAAFTSQGIPVVVGEWGSIDKSADDPASAVYRAYFARKLCENAQRTGCVPVIWDNGWNGKYGFALFNRGEKANDAGDIKPGTVAVSQAGIIEAVMGVYRAPNASASTATVSLDAAKLDLAVGAAAQLKATVAGGKADDAPQWRSKNETVAVVFGGKVLAVGPGITTVEAALPNGQTAFCLVAVKAVVGVRARVYLFEGAGWSAVRSEPIFIKAGSAERFEVEFKASELVLRNAAAMYLKDLEVEENKAAASILGSCVVTVESIQINGVELPLARNKDVEAVNEKGQLDLPMINEWAVEKEMVVGLPPAGNRDLPKAIPALVVAAQGNTVRVVFTANATADQRKIDAAAAAAAKPALDPAATYHAFLGIQAGDSWVFRNSYGSASYGAGTPEFEGGLFDTDNSVNAGGPVPGTIADAALTKADIEAGKTFKVSMVDFKLDDAKVKAASLNLAMISTDIPYGTVDVVAAKLFFDGKQVNLSGAGKDLFTVVMDKAYTMVSFINIWDAGVKAFGYAMPVKSVEMELTLALK
jgi:endoglucanase